MNLFINKCFIYFRVFHVLLTKVFLVLQAGRQRPLRTDTKVAVLHLLFCFSPSLLSLLLHLFPSASSSMRRAVYLQASGQTLTTSTGIVAPTLEWCWRCCRGPGCNVEGREEDETSLWVDREREREEGEIGKERCDATQIYGRGGSLN